MKPFLALLCSVLAACVVYARQPLPAEASVTLGQAIELVEAQGGRTVYADLVAAHDRKVWLVTIFRDSAMYEYVLDAQTGHVVGVEEERLRGRLFSLVTGVDLARLASQPVASVAAVAIAERETGKKAEALRVLVSEGHLVYEVSLVGSWKKFRVDAGTGRAF